ncbi:hypothetical protein N9E37_05380, partial [Luminiphilus sp.]|nr:hypothetical protein [Luminiphilus sp.]
MKNRVLATVLNVDPLARIGRASAVAVVAAFVALNFAASVEAQSDNDSPDTTPDTFTLVDQIDVARSTVVTSNEIKVSGIEAPADISVLGEGEYSINGGDYIASPGKVENGSTVTVRHTSSSEFKKAVNTLLDIGGLIDSFSSTTEEKDTVPVQFTFVDETDVALKTEITSNTITVSGINSAARISVTGGEYSIDGGAYTAADGTVENGKAVTVRHTSSASLSTATNTTLDIGGVTDTFNSTTEGIDTVPDRFVFEGQNSVARSTVITSNEITVSGINAPALLTTRPTLNIEEGQVFEWRINNGDWTDGQSGGVSGEVNNGDKVTVRHTSRSGFSTVENQSVSIGLSVNAGGTGFRTESFSTTTLAGNTTPTPFSFIDQTDVARSTVVTSNEIKVSGIEVAADISVTGGEYSINGGGYTDNVGTVKNDDTVTVRHTSSSEFNEATNTTLTIDIEQDTFTSRTVLAITTPDSFSFTAQSDVALSTL